MTEQTTPMNLPEPLPQIGAVLSFDSEVSSPDDRGSRYWKIAGSCVLLSPNRCLAVGHVLGGRSAPPVIVRHRYAVFFPYAGFFRLSDPPLSWEIDQTKGDNLALIALERPVEHLRPLRALRIPNQERRTGSAVVCGYGSWPGSAFDRLEGLQQQHPVRLGRPQDASVPGWRHYDQLDVSWSSVANGGLTAGRGNSGGPFLRLDNGSRSVIGITREIQRDQQAGSWIGNDRTRWLSGALNGQGSVAVPITAPLSTTSRLLTIGAAEGEVVRFEVPEGATQVQATLNASQGLRLQMGIVPAAEARGLLNRLKLDDEASGQFLYRDLKLPEGLKEIAVGVSPVANARADAESVFAQLCVLFK